MIDKRKIGALLTSKRKEFGLTPTQIGQRVGCDRTTVERWEKGITLIPRTKVVLVAEAYGIEKQQLAELCEYPLDSTLISKTNQLDSSMTASIEDFEFLLTIARGLQTPMSFATIRELLKCRRSQ